MRIRRFGPISVGKVAAVLYGAIGLLIGGVVLLVSLISAAVGMARDQALLAPLVGVAAVIGLPILYGGLGFVFATMAAWLYNAAAAVVGGVELDLE